MTAPLGITLSLDGVQQTEAGLRRVAGGVDAVGVSAKQTAAALRGVPAQFTDIVTSIASGQAPLTVFLQQGGQLKDMFGGAGNAAKALGGYVVGLVNPFTVAAAAGVALALAYKQGSAEADAYARSIALTGNAAGVTTSQLQGMAERVSAVAGTQSKAAEVVAQLVGTGSVASQSLEQFTATAIRLERNAGVAVKDTVKEFAELGKEPVEAAKKLNERYNYLTAAVYEQIKALQEQGKASEAAALSQQSYDKAMSLVASTLEGKLGYIERAWRAVGDASKWAWDKMLNVGRPDTLKDQLDRARANLEQRLNTPLAVDNPAMRASREKGIEALRNEINLLQEQERMMRRGADAQAERAKAEKAGIEAADALLKTQDKGLTKQQQMNAALKEYRAQLEALRAVNPNSERLAPAAVARGERAIRDQFKDQAGASTGESELATIKAKITETERYIDTLRTQGLEGAKLNEGERMALKIKEELKTSITGTARANKELALVEAEKLGLVQRAAAAEEQRQKAVKKSTDEYAKLVETTFKAADALQDQADKQQAANAVYGKGAAAIDQLALATLKSRMAEAQASDSFSEKYIAALEAQIQAQERLNAARAEGRFKEMNESLDRELAAANQQAALYQDELRLTGLSALERAKVVALRQSELALARDLEKIDQSGLEDAEKEQLRIKAREKQRVAGSAAVNKVVQDDFTRTSETIERSLTDALLRGFESGKGFAKNLRDTVANMFKTLVLRPVISAVVNPVAGAITGALGLAGTANAATSGASALGGIGNLASLGTNLFSSGLGSTISGAIGSGVGALFGTAAGNAALGTSLGLGAGSATAAAAAAAQAGGASAAAAASAASTGATIATAIPYIGAAVAALTLLAGSFKGETRYGGGFEVVNGKAFRTTGDVTNTLPESAIVQSVQGTFDSINKILGQYGSEFVATNIKAGIETSGKGRGGVFAGGLLSGGGATDIKFGKFFEDRIGASLSPEEAVKAFGGELNKAVIAALQAATDLPKYVQRQIESVDVNALGADKAAELLQTIGNLPNVLLQGFGTTRDALAQQFAQGLALGDATAAGKGVADTLVASIEASLYNDAAGKIFDIVNSGIVAPMLDAIATGASVSEALSQATIDKTIERAKAQASALSELFGNAEFVSALEQIRTTVGAALGQAGDSFGYTPKFQLQAAQQIDAAAQSASTAADEAARAWQQITDGLLTDRTTAEIALLRAQGREEEALARERAKAIEGFDAYQIGLYDGTQAILSQVTALEKQAEATKLAQERAAELASTLAGELPGAIAKFLSPDQKLAAGYTGIAADLSKVGINVDSGALATASLDQIAAAAMAVYNLGTTSDEARLALVRAASGLADLKAEATNLAASRTDAALAAVERAAQAQREVLQGTIDDVRAVFDAAASGVKSLRGQVDAVVQMSGKQGQAFIANALANARTTGYLPDGKDLQDAISAVTAGFDSAIFTTQADADYQRLVVAGNLEALQNIGGEQLTEAEKALETLDAQLQAAHDQLDALRGIQGGVLSMSEAFDRFGTALARESAVRGGGGGSGGGSGKPAVTLPGYLQGANGAAYDVKADMGYQAGTGLPWRGADVRSAAQQLLEAGNARGVYDAIKASGFTLAQADTILGLTAGEAEDWARSVGLPVFHSGTPYVPQTGLALLEQGERVIDAPSNRMLMAQMNGGGNTERLERLVEGLTAEVQRLQAVVAEGNGHQENTANTLGKVVVNNALITAPAPTF